MIENIKRKYSFVLITILMIIMSSFVNSITISDNSIITINQETNKATNFNKITPIDSLIKNNKDKKIDLLIPTLVDVPIQGKITYNNTAYNGTNIEVCIDSTIDSACRQNVRAINGIFNTKVLNVSIEDPHSLHYLTVKINDIAVVNNEPFYPAAAPQGNLTVNGDLIVTGEADFGRAIKIGDTAGGSPGSIKWDGNSFSVYTNSGWVSLTGLADTLWRFYSNYIYPNIFDNEVDRFIITNESRVGIGTTSPTSKLDVVGGAVIKGPSANVLGELVFNTAGNFYEYYNGTLWIPIPTGSIYYNGTLWTQNGTNIYYNAGFVGIGLTNPAAALDVNGKIFASQDICIKGGNCLSGGPAGPAEIRFSTTNHTGAISYVDLNNTNYIGYEAANKICSRDFPGSHLCGSDEIILFIANNDISSFSGEAWIAHGPPGYLAFSNDCKGWTSQDPLNYGSYWLFESNGGGMGKLTNCLDSRLPLGCCK